MARLSRKKRSLMLKPTSDFIVIETYSDVKENLVIPNSVKGDLFRVLDVGPGFVTSQGKRIKPDVRVNDIVAIVGNILTIPFQGERYQIARAGDVIAYYRGDLDNLEIPDKI